MPTQPLARAFASTRAILVNVAQDQLEDPTPCKSWNVRALINHVISDPRFVIGAITTGVGAFPKADFTVGDFIAHYDETEKGVLEAFAAPGALEKLIRMPFGEVPGALLKTMVTADQFTHGWDLARSTGQPTDLDPKLAADVLAQTQQFVTDNLRGDDPVAPFGPARQAPAGACPADQLAAFLGRSV